MFYHRMIYHGMNRFILRTTFLLTVFCVVMCIAFVSRSALAQPPAGGRAGSGGRGGSGGGRGPRYVDSLPYNASDHAGWQSMFDGSTLKGWEGPMDVWRVEDGAITASASDENRLPSVYLYWGGGDLKNFEFKTDIRLEGPGSNSGVQFRALRLGPGGVTGKYSEWESRGYQADFDYANTQTGALIECCSGPRRGVPPRPFKASMGTVVRAALTEDQKPTILATLGDPAELTKLIHAGDWNQVHIIARGNVLMYFINGRLMSEFLDDSPTMFVDHGELAIQLEGSGTRKVSFRNLWLKNLP